MSKGVRTPAAGGGLRPQGKRRSGCSAVVRGRRTRALVGGARLVCGWEGAAWGSESTILEAGNILEAGAQCPDR